MDLLNEMNKNAVKEFFSKNWMTHDAMWYGSCVKALGPAKANQINKDAVRSTSRIEIARIIQLMGKPKGHMVKDFDELAEIIETAFQLVQARFMKFNFTFPEKNLLRGQFNHCFAYEGVKKSGFLEQYDCGIVERIKGWLDGLGVTYQAADFTGCLTHKSGRCEVDFRFELA